MESDRPQLNQTTSRHWEVETHSLTQLWKVHHLWHHALALYFSKIICSTPVSLLPNMHLVTGHSGSGLLPPPRHCLKQPSNPQHSWLLRVSVCVCVRECVCVCVCVSVKVRKCVHALEQICLWRYVLPKPGHLAKQMKTIPQYWLRCRCWPVRGSFGQKSTHSPTRAVLQPLTIQFSPLWEEGRIGSAREEVNPCALITPPFPTCEINLYDLKIGFSLVRCHL